MGLNITTKDMLRAHVAATYLSKDQLAYYISKAYPGLSKRLEGNSGSDDLLKVVDMSEGSSPVSRKAVFEISEALAYDLGRVYQMGHNCETEFENSSPSMVAGLFINYFDEEDVQLIMNQYEVGMNDQKGKACDKEELQPFMNALIEKMANYIKLATPYTRPYSQSKKPKVSALPKDYKGELFPHFSDKGVKYVGDIYRNYTYVNIDGVGSLADNIYIASVLVAREDFLGLIYDHKSHKFAVKEINGLNAKAEPVFYSLPEDNLYVKMWNKAKNSEWKDKEIKIGSENKKWVYHDFKIQNEEVNRYYFQPEIIDHKGLDASSIVIIVANEKRYTFHFDPENNKFAPVAENILRVPLEKTEYREMESGGVGLNVWNFIKGRISAENNKGN